MSYVRTISFTVGTKSYCTFCANKTKTDSEGSLHNNDYNEFDICNCEVAVAYNKIQEEIARLNNYAYHMINSREAKAKKDALEYAHALKMLKNRYDIRDPEEPSQ